MSRRVVDGRGLSCPEPVIIAKEAIEELASGQELDVLVDTQVSCENVSRMASHLGCQVRVVTQQDGIMTLTIGRP